MKKAATLNTFTRGLEMDYHPMSMPNTALCNALNATTITHNGNEMSLLNDMGNGRVETAYLPEGFIPVGTVEFGGIIYIASYNPLTNRSLIGCFPSPERNITSDEVSACQTVINNANFILLKEYTNSCNPDVPVDDDTGEPITITMASIKSSSIKLKVLNSDEEDVFLLNPGDRFKIFVLSKEMLTKNAPMISDIYSNDANIVDATSRYLTIHIASLSTEGKVIALDNNLKWDWDGNNYAYYINEGGYNSSTGKIDIDEYRSLVSSAYNVYNSKVSGELALLFNLRTIESFTLTWDAEVNDNENPDIDKEKKAEIIFYANYTSTSPMVNAKYIIATGSSLKISYIDEATGEEVTKEDTEHNGCSFGTVYELDTFDPEGLSLIEPDDPLYRANNGMDDDIEYTTGSFYYDKDTMATTIWNYEFTPAMPFGNVDWLAIKGSINFKLLGSGEIFLLLWRYYISATTITLAWGLEAYPEKNKKIYSVTMEFIPSDTVGSDSDNAIYSLVITDKKSYSGYFLNLISFEDTALEPDKLYLVRIIVKYGPEEYESEEELEDRIYYRWLYTTGLWNEEYLSGDEEDFKVLTLNDVINFNIEYTETDNIDHYQGFYSTPVIIPELDGSLYDAYTMLGANITTVSYDWSDTHKFLDSNVAFSVDVSVLATNPLFSTTSDEITTILSSGTVSSDGTVLKGANSTIADAVTSITMGEVEAADGRITGMPTITDPTSIDNLVYDLSLGYAIEDIDGDLREFVNTNIAIDSFNALIDDDKKHFDIYMLGVIFSKINADIENKTCHTLNVIKPLLSTTDELGDYNLFIYNPNNSSLTKLTWITNSYKLATGSPLRFNTYYRLFAHDAGGGQGVSIYIQEYFDNNNVGVASRVGSYYFTYKHGDDWSVSSWGELVSYPSYIEPMLNNCPGPLLVVLYSTDGKKTDGKTDDDCGKSGKERWIGYLSEENHVSYAADDSNNPWTEYMGFWAKSTNTDEVLPLNFFTTLAWASSPDLTTSALAAIAASIYNSIYQIQNVGDLILLLDRVRAINYLGDIYRETWAINVVSTLSVSSDDIVIDSYKLSDIVNGYHVICDLEDDDNAAAGIANITFNRDKPYDFMPKTFSHEFKISNVEIWETYNALSSTSIPYAVYPEDRNVVYELTLDLTIDDNGFYVRQDDGTLTQLTASTARNVYLTKSLSIDNDGVLSNRIICVETGKKLGDDASNLACALIASLQVSNGEVRFGGSYVSGSGTMYFHMKDGKNTSKVGGCATYNFGTNYWSGTRFHGGIVAGE